MVELGADDKSRCGAYRELFNRPKEAGAIDEIRAATNGNYALGDERFRTEISAMLRRRVTPLNAGRPCVDARKGKVS